MHAREISRRHDAPRNASPRGRQFSRVLVKFDGIVKIGHYLQSGIIFKERIKIDQRTYVRRVRTTYVVRGCLQLEGDVS